MMRGRRRGFGMGFGGPCTYGEMPWGAGPYATGLNPWGFPRRSGWMVLNALASGPKSEQEIRDYLAKLTGIQLNYSMQPFLDYLASTGIIKKREDGKYELNAIYPYWTGPI